jgi:hypothetical protein
VNRPRQTGLVSDILAMLVGTAAYLTLTGNVSHCTSCGLTFRSAHGFDKHRIGAYSSAPPAYGRRCLTPDELRARGYEPDGKGRWRQPYDRSEVHA